MRNISNNAKQAIFSQESGEAIIFLLELNHQQFEEPLYLSSDPTQVISTGEYGTISNGREYTFLPMNIVLPPQDENLLGRAVIKIDNVSRDMIAAVIQINGEPITIDLRIVISNALNDVEIFMPSLRMNNIRANAVELEADLFPRIIQGEGYPYDTFTQASFPGLFSGL